MNTSRGNRRTSTQLLVALAALMLGSSAVNAEILIDDFTVGPFDIHSSNPISGGNVQVHQTGLDPAHVLGGRRGMSINYSSLGGSFIQIDGVPGARITIPAHCSMYPIGIYAEAPIGPYNFSQGGENAFAITLTEAPAFGYVGVFAHSGQTSRGFWKLPVNGPGTYVIPYSDIAPSSGETAPNFAAIDSMYFSLSDWPDTPEVDAVYRISRFEAVTVPEPSAMSAFALVAASLLRRKRPARIGVL